MSSFDALFKLAQTDPWKAAYILNKAAQSEEAYPDHICALYLLGIISGVCSAQVFGSEVVDILGKLKEGHVDLFAKIKPRDVLGSKRTYYRSKK